MNAANISSMFFSRRSWSHSAPGRWSKFVTEEYLERNKGFADFLYVRHGDAAGALGGFIGVAMGTRDCCTDLIGVTIWLSVFWDAWMDRFVAD